MMNPFTLPLKRSPAELKAKIDEMLSLCFQLIYRGLSSNHLPPPTRGARSGTRNRKRKG